MMWFAWNKWPQLHDLLAVDTGVTEDLAPVEFEFGTGRVKDTRASVAKLSRDDAKVEFQIGLEPMPLAESDTRCEVRLIRSQEHYRAPRLILFSTHHLYWECPLPAFENVSLSVRNIDSQPLFG